MKRLVLISTVLLAIFLSACDDKSKSGPSGPLIRSHFVGMDRINRETNAMQLKQIWALPPSQDLRKQALDKIAKLPFRLWHKSLPGGVTDQSKLIRPLLDDLVTFESYVELNGPEADFDSAVLVHLTPERLQLWQTNLLQLLVAWKLTNATNLNGTTSWETRANGITFRMQNKNNWLLAGWSSGKLLAINSLARQIEKSSGDSLSSTNDLLELHADLPSLGRWTPILAKHKLPPVDLNVSARGEYLRTEAQLSLSQPLDWKFQPWQIPTNLISEPLVSFSVAQGIEPLMKALPAFDDLGLKAIPTQCTTWSQKTSFFRNYWCFPVDNATNVVHQITPNLSKFLTHYLRQYKVQVVTNKPQVFVGGVALMLPGIEAVSDGHRDYLLLGLLPPPPKITPPPNELFSQLKGRTDLLYYHWEITEMRLAQARRFYDIFDFNHLRSTPPTNSPSVQWYTDGPKHLGNSITEVSMMSPKALKVVRKSHIGFTGFEIATLLRWVDSPGFPLEYQPPPPIPSRRKTAPLPKGNN